MLRDRYQRWGINDKNYRLTTQDARFIVHRVRERQRKGLSCPGIRVRGRITTYEDAIALLAKARSRSSTPTGSRPPTPVHIELESPATNNLSTTYHEPEAIGDELHAHTSTGPLEDAPGLLDTLLMVLENDSTLSDHQSAALSEFAFIDTQPSNPLAIPQDQIPIRKTASAVGHWYEAMDESFGNISLLLFQHNSLYDFLKDITTAIHLCHQYRTRSIGWQHLRRLGVVAQQYMMRQHPLDFVFLMERFAQWQRQGYNQKVLSVVAKLLAETAKEVLQPEHPTALLCGLLRQEHASPETQDHVLAVVRAKCAFQPDTGAQTTLELGIQAGRILQALGKFPEALDHLQRLLLDHESTMLPWQKAELLRSLAYNWYRQEQLHRSRELLNDAFLTLWAHKQEKTRRFAVISRETAIVHDQTGRPGPAEQSLLSALRAYDTGCVEVSEPLHKIECVLSLERLYESQRESSKIKDLRQKYPEAYL